MKNPFLSTLVIFSILVGACSDKNSEHQKTDFTENIKSSVIKTNEELFIKGNLDYADEVFSEDYAGQGPDWIKGYVGKMRTAFPDLQVSIEPIIAEDNMVAWQRTHTGTHQGEWMGFQPTGEKVTWKIMIFNEFDEEEKVVNEWYVSNIYGVLQKNKREEIEEE